MSINDDMMEILLLLGEEILPPGSSSILTGANTAQIAAEMPDVSMRADDDLDGQVEENMVEEPEFTDLELKLTKRYLELVGSSEKARDLIDKCDECMDCLGLLDDKSAEVDTISRVSEYVPQDVDLPTNNRMDLATLYNPNAVVGPFNR